MSMKETKEEKIYKYGLFQKGGWKPILLATTKEEAEGYRRRSRMRKILEVRKILWSARLKSRSITESMT